MVQRGFSLLLGVFLLSLRHLWEHAALDTIFCGLLWATYGLEAHSLRANSRDTSGLFAETTI
jgi:hypothetical protein